MVASGIAAPTDAAAAGCIQCAQGLTLLFQKGESAVTQGAPATETPAITADDRQVAAIRLTLLMIDIKRDLVVQLDPTHFGLTGGIVLAHLAESTTALDHLRLNTGTTEETRMIQAILNNRQGGSLQRILDYPGTQFVELKNEELGASSTVLSSLKEGSRPMSPSEDSSPKKVLLVRGYFKLTFDINALRGLVRIPSDPQADSHTADSDVETEGIPLAHIATRYRVEAQRPGMSFRNR